MINDDTQIGYDHEIASGKTGYFKVRAYVMINEKKCYSSYNSVKYTKAK